jgi:hypothetical protein
MGQRSHRSTGGSTTGGGKDVVQRAVGKVPRTHAVQRKKPAAADGGLPADLRAGTESMTGVDMSDVKVHRNSDKPAAMNAHAYAQGSDIHLGPGQDQHLPHEAWHVAQQKQGRVAATTQAGGVDVNEDEGLEQEADEMGAKAAAGGGGGSESQESEQQEAGSEGPSGGEVVQAKLAPGGVVQRVKKKSVVIDITTLSADECKEHISRSFRLKAGKGVGDDGDYEYEPDDVAKLQARQKALKEAEVLKKHSTLTAALSGQLAALATAADFVTPPPWAGKATTGSEGSETKKSTNMAADAGTVVAAWISFLGPGPYSNKHPRTGVAAAGRLVSADGKRSIRYGDHEQNPAKSKPPDHHYHEETWTWDNVSAVVVTNMVQKVPVT